jgi:outer membrane lipoprotein SlyB
MPFEPRRPSAPLLCTLAALALAGCSGRVVSYETISPKLDYSGRRTVAVAVRDAREQIAGGLRDPAVVGEAMVGGARKAPIATGNGEPLAAVIGKAVSSALEGGGFTPSIVETAPGEDREAVLGRALAAKPDYLWVIDIDDWWTARNKRTTHTYELAFAVLDAAGEALVERSFEGTLRWDEDGRPEDAPDAPAAAPESAPPADAAVAEAPRDPDAFDQPSAEAAPEAAPDAGEAAEGPPEPEPAGDPVAETLTKLLGDLLDRMINDADVPRKMVRFP